MAFSLDELTTPLTADEVKASIYTTLGTLGVATTNWKPGAVVRTMIAGTAIVIAASSTMVAEIAKSGFLELASGPWKKLVARYVYNVTAREATFATGEVTLTNTGGGLFNVDPGDLILAHATTGKLYRNTAAFTLNPLATLTIAISADEAGSDSNAAAGTITVFVTPLVDVTCTNANAVVGLDEETDQELQLHALEKLGNLSPFGPSDAYAFAAREATRTLDGSNVGVNRVRVEADGTGLVTIYVADTSGAITGDRTDPDTDLGAIQVSIQTLAETQAVTPEATSATPLPVAVSYASWVYNPANVPVATISAAVQSALATYLAQQPIGGNVIGTDPGRIFKSALIGVINNAINDVLANGSDTTTTAGVFRTQISLPVNDLDVDPDEAPLAGAVTASIAVVASKTL